jgi:threonine dehydrogenase-like Zn-dependent dehydrogenase
VRGILFPGGRQVQMETFPEPQPGPGEVVVRVRAAGLCGSDMNMLFRPDPEKKGAYSRGIIPGHETAGDVVALGAGARQLKPGDRVMVHWLSGCGYCPSCRSGWMIHCATPGAKKTYGWGNHGGDADYMVVDERSCVPLPEPLTYADGAIIACGGATAFQALSRLNPSGRDTLLVIGLGPVGLSAITFGKSLGAMTIGVDIVPARAELARKMGVDHCLTASGKELQDAIKELTGGVGVTVAMDCTGTEAGRLAAIDAAGIWGRVAFVGEGNLTTINVSPQVIHKQLTVIGSWYCGVNTLHEAASFLNSHQLDLARMVTLRTGLNDSERALKYFDTGGAGKVSFEFPG